MTARPVPPRRLDQCSTSKEVRDGHSDLEGRGAQRCKGSVPAALRKAAFPGQGLILSPDLSLQKPGQGPSPRLALSLPPVAVTGLSQQATSCCPPLGKVASRNAPSLHPACLCPLGSWKLGNRAMVCTVQCLSRTPFLGFHGSQEGRGLGLVAAGR